MPDAQPSPPAPARKQRPEADCAETCVAICRLHRAPGARPHPATAALSAFFPSLPERLRLRRLFWAAENDSYLVGRDCESKATLQVALTLKRCSGQEEKNCGWGGPLPRRSAPHLCDQSRTSDHGLVDAGLPLPAAAGTLHGPRGALW